MRNVLLSISFLVVCMASSSVCGADARTEYIARLAKVPPRSADAHVELGEWCKQNGLEAQATQCFEKAVSIDSDCEKARAALGYKQYGTSWVKAGEKPPSFARPAVKGVPPAPPPAAAPADPAGITPPTTAAPGASSPSSPPPATSSDGTPEVNAKAVPQTPRTDPASVAKSADAFAAEVEKKKAWAKTAADKLQTSFNTKEDADFLVHSTLPTASHEVGQLLLTVRQLKKTLAGIIGVSGSSRMWPDKLQLFLLKSEPEYERFASLADGITSAKNPEGAYTAGDHAALHNPESEALPHILGESAFKRLNGSDRWIAWWLVEGVSEVLYTQSPAGQKKDYYQTSMKYAADVLKAEGETLKIFNLLETASYKGKDTTKNRALALSLVDFLIRKNRPAFQEVIRQLKSDSAPAPPAAGPDGKEKEDFNSFHLSYISFQEKTLEAAFHMSLSAIQERWKAQTQQVAESIRASEANKAKEDTKASKKPKAPTKPTGKAK